MAEKAKGKEAAKQASGFGFFCHGRKQKMNHAHKGSCFLFPPSDGQMGKMNY